MPHFASAIFDGLEAQVSCERTQVGGIQRQCAQAHHLPGPRQHDLGPRGNQRKNVDLWWFMVIYGDLWSQTSKLAGNKAGHS